MRKAKRPRYDPIERKLWVGSHCIRTLRQPAPLMEAALIAFQNEGWPKRIADPFPVAEGIEPKSRLHEAIRRLNMNQHPRLLRFYGDGTARHILWKFVTAGESSIKSKARKGTGRNERSSNQQP